ASMGPLRGERKNARILFPHEREQLGFNGAAPGGAEKRQGGFREEEICTGLQWGRSGGSGKTRWPFWNRRGAWKLTGVRTGGSGKTGPTDADSVFIRNASMGPLRGERKNETLRIARIKALELQWGRSGGSGKTTWILF